MAETSHLLARSVSEIFLINISSRMLVIAFSGTADVPLKNGAGSRGPTPWSHKSVGQTCTSKERIQTFGHGWGGVDLQISQRSATIGCRIEYEKFF